jgi:hypothetical protein
MTNNEFQMTKPFLNREPQAPGEPCLRLELSNRRVTLFVIRHSSFVIAL